MCSTPSPALTGDAPSLDIEYRIVRPDGEIRWVRVRGFQVRDAAGKLIRITGIVTDITERKRAAETLRESEGRFSGAFEHAPIGVGARRRPTADGSKSTGRSAR